MEKSVSPVTNELREIYGIQTIDIPLVSNIIPLDKKSQIPSKYNCSPIV